VILCYPTPCFGAAFNDKRYEAEKRDRNSALAPVLETRGVTKAFARVVANKEISITLERGEVVDILGENGAGKTTLMNILFGLYRPTAGQIFLDGHPVVFDSLGTPYGLHWESSTSTSCSCLRSLSHRT